MRIKTVYSFDIAALKMAQQRYKYIECVFQLPPKTIDRHLCCTFRPIEIVDQSYEFRNLFLFLCSPCDMRGYTQFDIDLVVENR